MRKLSMLALALVLGGASVAHADEYVKGGFEMGGVINAGAAFQYADSNAGSYGALNGGAMANPYGPVGYGVLGEFNRWPTGPAATGVPGSAYNGGASTKNFQFYVDGVQLNLSKSFGENIRARADLVFGAAALGSSVISVGNTSVNLAQAYVTANIPAGNGVEFLMGEFFVPFGYEKVFRNENNTATHSAVFFLRPTTLTGAKFYYAFTDLIDLHVYAVNNLRNNLTAGTSKNYAGVGVTLGFNWGDEGKKSRVDVTGMFGPESVGNTTGGANDKSGHWTYIGDVSWNWHINDAFTLGGEGLYRMDRDNTGVTPQKIFAGVLDLNYAFTDVWDGTFKVAYAHQNDMTAATATSVAGVAATGLVNSGALRTNLVQGSLATQYQIADGAKIQAEFRLDYAKSPNVSKAMNYGPIVNFAYAF